MKFICIFITFFDLLSHLSIARELFTERFHWSVVDYAFQEVGMQIDRDSYRLGDSAIRGIHLWKDKLFLINYHIKTDDPGRKLFPLTYINLNTTEKSPLLIPYPKDQPRTIRHIDAVEVDICDRLWALDSDLNKLFIIDLNQNKIIREIEVPPLHYTYTITVDVNPSDCNDAYAYLPSKSDFQIFVHRLADNTHWKTGEPNFLHQNVTTYNFELADLGTGIYSIACVASSTNLFLQPAGSEYLLNIPANALRKNNADGSGSQNFTVFGHRGENTWSTFMCYDEHSSIMFFDVYKEKSLACWNRRRFPQECSQNTTHIVKSPMVDLSDILDLRTDGRGNLYVAARSMRYENSGPDYDFFVYIVNIRDLVKGTVCEYPE